ncbi:chemotaxis protein CheW, partial [Candidatus Pyrohabitans sp.]
ITPVMDMRKKLNAERKNNRDTRIVIVENKGENMGIIVDAVTGVIQIPEESISPPPVADTKRFIRGLGKIKDKLIILVDIGKMVENGRT